MEAPNVVTKDVAPCAVIVGILAKHICSRFHKDRLLKVRWWEWLGEIIAERPAKVIAGILEQLERNYCASQDEDGA